jgi:hypothetical protein
LLQGLGGGGGGEAGSELLELLLEPLSDREDRLTFEGRPLEGKEGVAEKEGVEGTRGEGCGEEEKEGVDGTRLGEGVEEGMPLEPVRGEVKEGVEGTRHGDGVEEGMPLEPVRMGVGDGELEEVGMEM